MRRRRVLKLGFDGLAASALAGALPVAGAKAQALTAFRLAIEDITVEMIDGTPVAMFGYRDLAGTAPATSPGRVLRVAEGASVEIRIENRRPEPHAFEIAGIAGTRVEIAAGATAVLRFTAPQAGSYLYHDPWGGSPLYRVLGAYGAFIVHPARGTVTAASYPSPTPYSLDRLAPGPRAAITALFGALGATARFQGGAGGVWRPAALGESWSDQEKIWIFSQVDPRFNALISPGRPIRPAPALTGDVVANWTPRYFVINNRSGFDLEEGEDVVAKNYIGEPTLIRCFNAGLAHHSAHIHGNHLFELARAELDPASANFGRQVVADNLVERDVWAMFPMERKDMLLPYEIPPDIPFAVPSGPAFLRMVKGTTQEKFPLVYVMHCHTEMSQTAAGGNYPQGLVSHWEILGGLGGRARAKTST